MSALTISKSGTAWFQDMQAMGKSPTAGGGWANSPNAAYYASLDTSHPLPKPDSATVLPTSMADLMKLRDKSAADKDDNGADKIQQQLVTMAADNALPTSGNIINTQA